MSSSNEEISLKLDKLVEAGAVPEEDADLMRPRLDDPDVQMAINFMGSLMAGGTAELVMVDEDAGRTETITTESLGDEGSVLTFASSDGILSDEVAGFAASQVPIEDKVPENFGKSEN
jgi:hypothetical protein